MKHRTSIIWTIDKEILQNLFDTMETRVSILKHLGLDGYNGHHSTLTRRVKEDNIELTKHKENYKKYIQGKGCAVYKKRLSNSEFFRDNCEHKLNIRPRIIRDNLIEYKCVECGLLGEYNGKPLTLQLDHINGVNTDNRLENLRFLCPNCHTQTDTYGSKKLKKSK